MLCIMNEERRSEGEAELIRVDHNMVREEVAVPVSLPHVGQSV